MPRRRCRDFSAWWGSQLVACLPARWRALVEERSESLLIDLRPDELDRLARARRRTQRIRAHRAQPAAPRRRVPNSSACATRSTIRGVRIVLCIPAERVLQRNLTLPAAAEENLRQVLAFEMDRQTPFKADQIYFD